MKTSTLLASRVALIALAPSVALGFWFGIKEAPPAQEPAPHWLAAEDPALVVLRSPGGYQTVTRRDGGRTGLYYDSGELVGQLRPMAQDIALLGMGGGEMLRAAWRSLPHTVDSSSPVQTPRLSYRLIGVELDAKTAELAVSKFHIDELGVQVVVADALDWIAVRPKASLDVVMVDVYADSKLPEPFRRLAFFIDCARALRPSGLLLMNVWPRELVPEVRKAMEVLFKVTERGYGPNTILLGELR
jgi:spermidine synthase